MKVIRMGDAKGAIADIAASIEESYQAEKIDIGKHDIVGEWPVSKSEKDQRILVAPYSMAKLLKLLEYDEYHAGCVDAIGKCAIMKFECSNANVRKWLDDAEFQGNNNAATILEEMVKYYVACGNGLLVKMRDQGGKGQWRGLERMLPTETVILERYDEFGFFQPDFVMLRNQKRRFFPGKDIIHFKRPTHKSNAWGLSSLPVAINAEILKEIKTLDMNNFKSGMLIDYIFLVMGGTLRDAPIEQDGEETTEDAYSVLERTLREVKGNRGSHSSVLLESENTDVKITPVPLRQNAPEGGFIQLKKDLREGIFAYHRVPPRVVSQTIAGSLGGDYANDMKMFASFVIKPLQHRIATMLAKEFKREFGWAVRPDDFDFGNPAEVFENPQDSLFKKQLQTGNQTNDKETL